MRLISKQMVLAILLMLVFTGGRSRQEISAG